MMNVALFVLGILLAIIGFFATDTLSGIEKAIIELSTGLKDTSIDLAKLTSKTEAVLEHHEKRLDTHENILEKIKESL